ncbi:MAG: hypothetical protein Q7T79_00680 [bacterium]|nr:hypothetical protein [bacterium]
MKNIFKFINIKYLISIFFFCIFFIPTNVFASCSKDGYTVIYVNGIFTSTEELAKADMKFLEKNFKDSSSIKNVTFETGYNESHIGGLGDLVQSAAQIINFPIGDYDFKTILTQIHSKIKTKKIILVGHSQGTLYTNELYDYLIKNGVSKESIAVYNVATPADYVAGNGEYLTSKNDRAINSVRNTATSLLAPKPLPGNADLPLSAKEQKDLFGGGHSFSENYLVNAPSSIISSIENKIKNLVSVETTLPEQGCFNLPDKNWTFKTQEILFSIIDPIGNTTVYVAKAGIDGAVVVAKATANTAIVVVNSTVDAVVFAGKVAVDTGKTVLNTASALAKSTAEIVKTTTINTINFIDNTVKIDNSIKNKTEIAVVDSNKIVNNIANAKTQEQKNNKTIKQENAKVQEQKNNKTIKQKEAKMREQKNTKAIKQENKKTIKQEEAKMQEQKNIKMLKQESVKSKILNLKSEIITSIINPLPVLASDLPSILEPIAQKKSQYIPLSNFIFSHGEPDISQQQTSTSASTSTSVSTSTLEIILDKSSNATSTLDIILDESQVSTSTPETILDKFPNATTTLTTADFSFSSDKLNSSFQYSLDDQEYENGTSTKQYFELNLGNHILKVRAIDEFKNIDDSPIIFQWEIIEEFNPTYLSGELKEDMTLLAENNPYIIEENFLVPENITLTINPGVIIWVKTKNIGLTVDGTLIINGTKENPVKFTSSNKVPQLGDYGQALLINKTSKNTVLDNVIFEYGDKILDHIIPMVSVQGADVKIFNSIFRKAKDLALSFSDSNSLIENVLFEDNKTTALSIQGGEVEIKECQFKNNYVGIELHKKGHIVFKNNLYVNNQYSLFSNISSGINFQEDKQLSNNDSKGIFIFFGTFPNNIAIIFSKIYGWPYVILDDVVFVKAEDMDIDIEAINSEDFDPLSRITDIDTQTLAEFFEANTL